MPAAPPCAAPRPAPRAPVDASRSDRVRGSVCAPTAPPARIGGVDLLHRRPQLRLRTRHILPAGPSAAQTEPQTPCPSLLQHPSRNATLAVRSSSSASRWLMARVHQQPKRQRQVLYHGRNSGSPAASHPPAARSRPWSASAPARPSCRAPPPADSPASPSPKASSPYPAASAPPRPAPAAIPLSATPSTATAKTQQSHPFACLVDEQSPPAASPGAQNKRPPPRKANGLSTTPAIA